MKIAMYTAVSGTLVDKAIDAWTGFYGYSHCEVVFDQIFPVVNNKWLTCSSSPREGELRFKRIDIQSGHWYVVDLPDVTVEKEQEIYNYLQSIKGAKYDWKGIFFWFIFPWFKSQSNKKWWCSEICAYVLDKFNVKPMKFRIDPNKFAKILGAPRGKFSFKFTFRKNY